MIVSSSTKRYSQNWVIDVGKMLKRGCKGMREEAQAPCSLFAWCTQKHVHIQINIRDRQSLQEVQKNPEKYRDLSVYRSPTALISSLIPGQRKAAAPESVNLYSFFGNRSTNCTRILHGEAFTGWTALP